VVAENPETVGKPTCVEYCTGIGGLSAGLETSGFRHVLGVEHDPAAVRTLTQNGLTKRWNILEADVRAVDPLDHIDGAEIDLFASGVPCQPFSQGGVAKGADDPRNLFPEAIEAVRSLKPKLGLFENVRGLARPVFAEFLEYVLDQLRFPALLRRENESAEQHAERLRTEIEKDGGDPQERYLVECHKINVADFGPIGQRRHRLIFTMVRSDLAEAPVWPEQTHSREALVKAKHDGSYWVEHGLPSGSIGLSPKRVDELLAKNEASLERWLTLRDVIEDLPELKAEPDDALIDGHYFWPGARVYRGHSGSLLDEPSKTIKAGVHGVPGGEHIVILDSEKIRYLSVRECARIQALSDKLVFDCDRSAAMRQIGNAVPPPIGEIFGTYLLDHLGEDSQWPDLETDSPRTTPQAVASIA